MLLTADNIADRTAYVNAQNALATLFGLRTVPIVNENDTAATDEITFGDNDALAAQVAVLVRARLLVLLTEVEGVLTQRPGLPGAELIPDGATIDEAVLGEATGLGKGGIRSKVVAARMAGAARHPDRDRRGRGEGRARTDCRGTSRAGRTSPRPSARCRRGSSGFASASRRRRA